MKIARLKIPVSIRQRVVKAHAQNQEANSGNPSTDNGEGFVHSAIQFPSKRRKIRAAVAKEVGVENPAEETTATRIKIIHQDNGT